MYKYEEALQASVDYFDKDELAAKVFVDKYALRDNNGNILEKTPEDMHHRISKEFYRVEKEKFKNPLSYEEIFGLLDHFKYIVPQGSPMTGIGNPHQYVSLSNCFLLEIPEDSYNSIMEVDRQLVNISKRRGGVGIDLSKLRPKNSPVTNAARSSTGIVSWMERYSNSTREVGQSARRGALMLTIDVHHPDILDFATIKNDDTKVTGANISVRLSKEFLIAVENNIDYELRFPVDYKKTNKKPLISKMVNAREVWKTIIHSAWLRAEPGLLMWDNITTWTPADAYEEFRSRGTNPCSELNLSPLDSCRLLLLNLLSYVRNPFTENAYFDYDLFYAHAKIAQRLMDNMVDLELESIDRILRKIESDPESDEIKNPELKMWQKIRNACERGRRTGTGITALGDTLAALGIKYGNDQSILESEKIYKTLKHACYESSIEMAEELGPFLAWNRDVEKDHPFLLRLKDERPDLYERMLQNGRRNIALLTTAPAGSVSIETRTSSGIEPVPFISYERKKKVNPNDENVKIDYVDGVGDKWQIFKVYHPTVNMWMNITGETDITKSPWHQATCEEIDWVQRVKLQAAAQKHVCHSISSTINLPADVTEEKIAEIYETAFKSGCKGITVYRSGCRSGVIVDSSSKKQEAKTLSTSTSTSIIKTNAPKRPSWLPCSVHTISVKGQKHVIVIGLWEDNQPYEVFAYEGSTTIKSGRIYKRKRGSYDLISDDKQDLPMIDISELQNDDQETFTRMVSTSLRHGVPLDFVVHQLEKVKGDLTNISKCVARVLKKYIEDDTQVKGEACGECKVEALVRSDGCVTCKNCGWSKC